MSSVAITSNTFRFSAAVVGLGLIMKDSNFKGAVDYDLIARYPKSTLGKDVDGY